MINLHRWVRQRTSQSEGGEVPASRSKLRKANSVAFDPDRGALPLTTRKFETCKSDVGFEGMRKDVNAMSAPSTNVTVVRNEKTPFSRCIVVCIVVDVSWLRWCSELCVGNLNLNVDSWRGFSSIRHVDRRLEVGKATHQTSSANMTSASSPPPLHHPGTL